MSDGGSYSSLRQRYNSALSVGESSLRALLGAPSSSWKSLPTSAPRKLSTESTLSRGDEATSNASAVTGGIEGPIIMHKKRSKGAPDIVRAVCHVPVSDHAAALESFRAVLSSSEIRHNWDTVTEKQETLEIVEPSIRAVRNFTRIGWPSSPRDVVAINKVLIDPTRTLIDLSISLSRSAGNKINDDPPFLQPSPPYVRSHLHLCAFVVTFPVAGKARLSMYWQWNLRGSGVVWTNHVNAIPTILGGLVGHVREHSSQIPYDRLLVEYGVFQESDEQEKDNVRLDKSKERRRLERAIEIRLPPLLEAGWDITLKTIPENAVSKHWDCVVEQLASTSQEAAALSRLTLRVNHSKPDTDFVKVILSVQRLAGGKTLLLNGEHLGVSTIEERNPASFDRVPSLDHIAPNDTASLVTATTADSTSSASLVPPSPTTATRLATAKQSYDALNAHTQRSYTTFLALLQSPAGKWKSVADVRRVTVSSYASIDTASTPIYKHEVSFVNTSLWDVFSVFMNGGARLVWDKYSGLEEFKLLKEVESTESNTSDSVISEAGSGGEGLNSFWAAKWKAVWPAVPRDAVLLRTVYRSPTSIHILYTSVTEADKSIWEHVADTVPAKEANTIRIGVKLQAIAIDQISPTTTAITVVDQTNLGGWSRSSYAAMAEGVASMGDFALKAGAPPVLTRLSSGRVISATYVHATGIWSATYAASTDEKPKTDQQDTLECVIRCDTSIWSSSGLDVSIEPPQSRISILARHRLSDRGSGCWLTIEHTCDCLPAGNTPVTITIRRAAHRQATEKADKGAVWVNGIRVKVEVEELKDEEVKELKAKRRIKNRALMLDQPLAQQQTLHRSRSSVTLGKQDLAAIASAGPPTAAPSRPPSIINIETIARVYPPIHYALEGLAWLQALHADLTTSDAFAGASDWTILSYAENNSPIRISKILLPKLSAHQPIFRVERNFPKVSADQVMDVVSALSTANRTAWDDRISSTDLIHTYENSASTSVWTTRPNFPFRSKVVYAANSKAQFVVPAPPGSRKSTSTVHMFASVSVPLAALQETASIEPDGLDVAKLNPGRLGEARVFLEGWILETIDNSEEEDEEEAQPVPSHTRCSFFTCSDLPSTSSGKAFGLGNTRTRFSTLFDNLERILRSQASKEQLLKPASAMHIEGSIQQHGGRPGQWQLDCVNHASTILSAEPGRLFVTVSLPRTPEPASGSANGNPAASASATNDRRPPAPKQSNSSGSLTRFRSNSLPAPTDFVLSELLLTRDNLTTGYDFKVIATMFDTKQSEEAPLLADHTSWRPLTALPVKLTAYPLSMPVSQATVYLVRLTLPTSQVTSPLQHPLSGVASKPTTPLWFRKLSEGKAIIHVSYSTVRHVMHVDGRPPSPLQFTLEGVGVPLAGDAESKIVAEQLRDEEEATSAARLRRIIAGDQGPPLPKTLSNPRLLNAKFAGGANTLGSKDATASSPGVSTPPAETAQRRTASEATITSTVANIEKVTQPVLDMFTVTNADPAHNAGLAVSQRTYKFSFVLLVAVISFLVGSLLRSLLSPNDYVFFTSSINNVESAMLELVDPTRKWKYATRFVHLHIPWFNRDLVASIVEQG